MEDAHLWKMHISGRYNNFQCLVLIHTFYLGSPDFIKAEPNEALVKELFNYLKSLTYYDYLPLFNQFGCAAEKRDKVTKKTRIIFFGQSIPICRSEMEKIINTL